MLTVVVTSSSQKVIEHKIVSNKRHCRCRKRKCSCQGKRRPIAKSVKQRFLTVMLFQADRYEQCTAQTLLAKLEVALAPVRGYPYGPPKISDFLRTGNNQE